MAKKIRVIIVDDESLARESIKNHLEKHKDMEIVGEGSNGFEAVKLVHELNPDIVFLDIQMPKLNGFDVIELLGNKLPSIIFITAFDEYALRAFEAQAMDYILKPVKGERFDKALLRVKQQLGNKQKEKFSGLLDTDRNNRKPISRILIRDGVTVIILKPENILYVEAYDDYVKFHTADKYWVKNERMQNLENNLDSRIFCRIHRSFIVNINFIDKIEPYSKDSKILKLHTGKTLPISKSGYSRLMELM